MEFWWERQYVGRMAHKQLPSVSYMDYVIENFSCLTEDDYLIEGEMGMQVSTLFIPFNFWPLSVLVGFGLGRGSFWKDPGGQILLLSCWEESLSW